MTSLAKLLVFLNLFLGVGLFAWGLSVYTNRVDYFEKETGATTRAKAEIDRLTKVINDGNAAFNRRRTQVTAVETRRDTRQAAYQARLAEARGGRFREQVGIPDAGFGSAFTDLDQTGKDVTDATGKPLEGYKVLQDKFAVEVRTIETLIGGKQKLPEEQWQAVRSGTLTLEQLAALQPELGLDDLAKMTEVLTDLIKLDDTALAKARDVQANLAEESAFLADLRVNVGAELQLLQTRERQLSARLQSLSAAPTARR